MNEMATILFAMHSDDYGTEPMNLMLLSALAKAEGRRFDTAVTVLNKEDLGDAIKRTHPTIVAMSAITGSHNQLIAANRRIKQEHPSIKTVIGGPYATFRPQLINEEPFDAIGIGECDEAWPALLDEWAAGRTGDGVHNIITQTNASQTLQRTLLGSGGWVIKPEHLRPRMTELDRLPFLDRDVIFKNTKFGKHKKRAIMAGRGCPFRCTYCFEHAWNRMYEGKGAVLQRYSVKRLCAELAQLVKDWPNTEFIKFYDDVFPCFGKTDRDWLEEFAEVYPREIGLPFHALVRAELVNEENEEKLRLLKKAGIASLTMSIEGGNAFARDYVLIRDMSDDDLRKSFAICRKLKINTFANTIMAVPVPTLPDIHAPEGEYRKQLDRILSVASTVDPKRKVQPKKIAKIVEEAEAAFPAGGMLQRRSVDKALRAIDVRATPIEYDRESVWYNVKLGVSFGEFPVFFPYEGTHLGAYSLKIGAFDGNYDKLHESYQTASPLTCFDEKEKLEQQNLALFGTVVLTLSGSYHPVIRAMAWPLTWFLVNVLAPLPFTSQYVKWYTITKTYMHKARVYPSKSAWKDTWNRFKDSYRLDVLKQLKKDIPGTKPGETPKERVGQTLGGNASH
jgi:radical SAM superfamily enzyme YgiQ (UPF0313 family)